MMKNKYDNILDILQSATTSSEILTRLSMSERLPDSLKIWTQLFYFEGNIFDYYKESRTTYSLERKLSDGGIILKLNYIVGRKNKLHLNGLIALLPSSQSSIYRAISICNSTFWKKAAARFIENSYPKLVRIFYRQNELKSSLSVFESKISFKFDIAVKDLTIKERRYSSSNEGETYDSERKWTESRIEKAFTDAKERSQWFNSLHMSINRKNLNQAEAFIRVTKYGLISQDHLYELTSNILFPSLEIYAFQKTTLFSKRGLQERNYIPSSPLAITYNIDLFNETKNVRQLVRVLKMFPHSSKAIYHGNPYLHMSIADFIDGSSYEIWVLNPRRILLIPQMKTSIQSLEKIVSHIFEKYREGEVGEVDA